MRHPITGRRISREKYERQETAFAKHFSELREYEANTKGILPDARLQDVQIKARFGHKDWIYWKERSGTCRAEWKSAESMKRALLDTGTRGFWCLVMADSGCPIRGFWALGINIINQFKRGY